MATFWPEADQGAEIIRRLLAGDPTAPADFAAGFLDPLIDFLRAANPQVDDHARITAAADSILSIIRHPTQFDPTRGDVPKFLRVAARGDLANILEGEQRHHRHRENSVSVELGVDDRNCSEEEETLDLPSFDDPRLVAVIAAFTDEEHRVLDLLRDGERQTVVFAAALGITDRPQDEQLRVVKQVKDRIKARLRRAVGGI